MTSVQDDLSHVLLRSNPGLGLAYLFVGISALEILEVTLKSLPLSIGKRKELEPIVVSAPVPEYGPHMPGLLHSRKRKADRSYFTHSQVCRH